MNCGKFKHTGILLIIFLSVSVSVFALDGRIVAEGDSPVADSTVVLLEFDLITITDSDGLFSFEDVPVGKYTILVIAPGYEEKEFSVSDQQQALLLSLTPEIIEMDVITVQAASEEASDQINEGVTSEELERQPVRSDPFKAVALESGILKELDVVNFNMDSEERGNPGDYRGPVVIPEGRVSLSGRNEVSVYGGESDWNNYYYDYIRLPTNNHTFGFPDADSIVPREAVDSIEIYRGAYPVEYGPGIGGLFSLNPKKDINGFEINFTPSIMDVSALTSLQISDNISMLLSLNQSIMNYTVLPIISGLAEINSEEELVEGEIPTRISYGDALLRFLFTPPGHSISVDFIGYYDKWAFDLGFENATLDSNYGPYYLAGGSKWLSSINDGLSNSLYIFGSLYKDTGNFDFYLPSSITGFTTDYHLAWVSNVNSLQAGNELQWSISPEMMFLAGINGRLSDLNGTYSDTNEIFDENELELENMGYSHNILFEELLVSTYAYAKILGSLDELEYKTGAGLLLYPTTLALRPAVEGELIYSAEKSSFAIAAGWSPGVIDEFTYIDRRLDELYYDLESETSAYQPPMAAAAAGQAVFLVDENSSLKLSPYFSWYYDLSGISMSTSYNDELDNTFVSLDPAYGYSTGIDIGWSTKNNDFFDWDISYAFAWTRYYTDELGWVVPNTEVQHALKGSGLFRASGFKTGLSLFIYSGLPFTPQVVEDGLAGPETVQGEYNTAIEWIPSYELTANVSYEWEFKLFNMSLFFNSSNLVDGLNVTMDGLKEELKNVVGSTTADFSSRNYSFSYTLNNFLMTLLTSEIGLSFSI